jgi:16S rRNA (adenine1518-N6/adenine1519-N6)-dimethyltransferase
MTVRPKKSLGQHFLHDENIARKIAGSLDPEIPTVVEVGPGKGALSKYLLGNPAFDPWFIEIDRESVAYLKEHYPAIQDRVIEADFLTFDLQSFIQSLNPEPLYPSPGPSPGREGGHEFPIGVRRASDIQILGNFPYNISSQILFKVLKHRDLVGEVVGMFQKEVAERIAAPPGSKTYGILSVMLQAWYRIEYLFTVPASVFYPPPDVKSAVIRLKRNDVTILDCNEELWMNVVKTAFNQRRKMLRNSLRKLAGNDEKLLQDNLFTKRPEQLSVQEFVGLTRRIEGISRGNS